MRLNIVITYERLTFEPEIQILRTCNSNSSNSQLKIFELATRNL